MPRKSADGDELKVPYRWRKQGPDTRSEGTMYQFVRDHIRSRGNRCTLDDLRAAMEADPQIAQRLSQSQGFAALLANMKHSGEVTFDGNDVVVTPRALRHPLGH